LALLYNLIRTAEHWHKPNK